MHTFYGTYEKKIKKISKRKLFQFLPPDVDVKKYETQIENIERYLIKAFVQYALHLRE